MQKNCNQTTNFKLSKGVYGFSRKVKTSMLKFLFSIEGNSQILCMLAMSFEMLRKVLQLILNFLMSNYSYNFSKLHSSEE